MISWLRGDDLGVPRIPECWVVEWHEGSFRIVCSFVRQGNAISAHFAAAKESLKMLRTAIGDFVAWAFEAYDWCEMVLALVGISSVARLVQRCGFVPVAEVGPYTAYMRARS
jgi:hypothetical protein